MPITAPLARTYFHQKSVTPASIATRGSAFGQHAVDLYFGILAVEHRRRRHRHDAHRDALLGQRLLRLQRKADFRAGRDQHRACAADPPSPR